MALENTLPLKRTSAEAVPIIPPVSSQAPAIAPADAQLIDALTQVGKGVRGAGTGLVTEGSLERLNRYVISQQSVVALGSTTAEQIEQISLSNGRPVTLGMAQLEKKEVSKTVGEFSSRVLDLYAKTTEESPWKERLKGIHDRVENFRRDLQDEKFSFSGNKADYNRLINDVKTFSADLNNDSNERSDAAKRLGDLVEKGSAASGALVQGIRSNPSLVARIRDLSGASQTGLAGYDHCYVDPSSPGCK